MITKTSITWSHSVLLSSVFLCANIFIFLLVSVYVIKIGGHLQTLFLTDLRLKQNVAGYLASRSLNSSWKTSSLSVFISDVVYDVYYVTFDEV